MICGNSCGFFGFLCHMLWTGQFMATFIHPMWVCNNCVVVRMCIYTYTVCMSSFLHTGNGIVKVGQVMMVSINTLVFMYVRMTVCTLVCINVCVCMFTVCLSMCVCLIAECVHIRMYVRTHTRTHACSMYVCVCVCTDNNCCYACWVLVLSCFDSMQQIGTLLQSQVSALVLVLRKW